MEVIEAIKNRYSCRDYKNKTVEKQKLEQIMDAARLAPSGGFASASECG